MDLNEYQAKCRETAVYREVAKDRLDRMAYCVLGLSSEAGEVAGQMKRIIRDDTFEVTGERMAKIADEIGDCLYYIAMLADDMDCDLDSIAKGNLEKLKSRMERGVINGSGGER